MTQHLYPAEPGAKEKSGTSAEAAAAVAPDAATLRGQVLAALIELGPMTADEVAAALGLSVLSVRPRVSELAAMERIERTGERRQNVSGMNAAVWRVKPK